MIRPARTSRTLLKYTVAVFLMVMTLSSAPRPAQAQWSSICEPFMFVATRDVSTIHRYLDCWWHREFKPSLDDMTEHISIQFLEHARILATFIDSQNTNIVISRLKRQMLEAGRRYRPSDLACIAGTGSLGLTRANMAARTMAEALDQDALARAANHVDSPGAGGLLGAFRNRWTEYANEFCDPALNVGHMGATCNSNTWRNGDVLVGEVLINNKTISDEGELRAVTALIRSIIEPGAASPHEEQIIEGPKGKNVWLERRAAIAARQAAQHVFSSIAGKRMPGSEAGPWLKALSEQHGVPDGSFAFQGRVQNYSSVNPSYNELMSVLTKQRFSDPQHFVRLSEDPEMAARDRISNLAYKLMTLRDRYEVLEQFALILAIETSLVLNR